MSQEAAALSGKTIDESEVSECISEKVDEGMDQDQAVAICLNEAEEGSTEPEKMNAEEKEERIQEVVENRDQIQTRNFQITGKDVELVKNEEDKGDVAINVPIQAISEDRDGDIITEQGQDDIIRQLRSGTVPLMLNHGIGSNPAMYDVRDIIGQFVDGDKEQGTTMGVARMRKKPESEELTEDAKEIVDLLKQDMPIGFSVGFIPQDVDEKEDGGNEIKSLDLMEVSAVGIPSNPEAVPQAMGTAAQMAKNAGLSKNEIMETVKSAFNDTMSDKDEQSEQDVNTTQNEEDSKSEENMKQITQDELDAVLGAVGGALDAHMDAAMQDIESELEEMVMEEDEMDEDEDEEDMEQEATDDDEDDEEEMSQEPEEQENEQSEGKDGSDHTEDEKSAESEEKDEEEIESTAEKNKQENHKIQEQEEKENSEDEKEVDQLAEIAADKGEMWS